MTTEVKPGFNSLGCLNRVLGLVMEHYNGVARTLIERLDNYTPLFAAGERNDESLWYLWIEGFEIAVALRPWVW